MSIDFSPMFVVCYAVFIIFFLVRFDISSISSAFSEILVVIFIVLTKIAIDNCISFIKTYKMSVQIDKFKLDGEFFEEMIDYDRKFCRQTDGDSLVTSLN